MTDILQLSLSFCRTAPLSKIGCNTNSSQVVVEMVVMGVLVEEKAVVIGNKPPTGLPRLPESTSDLLSYFQYCVQQSWSSCNCLPDLTPLLKSRLVSWGILTCTLIKSCTYVNSLRRIKIIKFKSLTLYCKYIVIVKKNL